MKAPKVIALLLLVLAALIIIPFLLLRTSLLQYATVTGNIDVAKLALLAGADPNARDHEETSFLEAAIALKSTMMVATLLDHGADPDLPGFHKKTALHLGAAAAPPEIFTLLASKSKNIETVDDGGDTPLLIAMMAKSEANARLLLKRGANPNVINNIGVTPIYAAVNWNHEGLLKLLIEKGGNNLGKDSSGKTALDLARHYNDEDLIKLIEGLATTEE